MNDLLFLQLVGLGATGLTLAVACACGILALYGSTKPNYGVYAVWAMALFFVYMGLLSTYAMSLPGYVQGQ